MRVLFTTASALALLAAPAFAQTPPPGVGTSGATTSGSSASSSTTSPSLGATTGSMTGRTGNATTGGHGTPGAASRSAGNQSNQPSSSDKNFVKKAASSGIAEVQMGKLAAQKSTNPAVQEFGRWMQTDHTMANALLMQAAQSANVPAPTTPTQEDLTKMKDLQTMSGARFDAQYIRGQVSDHKTDINLFKREAADGRDTRIKSFAKASLPMLQAHLQEAQALESSLSNGQTATSAAAGSPAIGNTALGAGKPVPGAAPGH
jgi:putative membrane protein